MNLDDELREGVGKLAKLAEPSDERNRDLVEPHEEVYFAQGEGLLFRGEGLRVLRELEGQLAKAALVDGGPSERVVHSALVRVCWDSRTGDLDAALQRLEETLSAEPTEWIVVEPIAAHIYGESVRIGACTVRAQLTEVHGQHLGEVAEERFAGAVIEARVTAKDRESAREIALENIAESKAVMTLIDTRQKTPDTWFLIGEADEFMGTSAGGGESWILTWGMYRGGGLLHQFEATSEMAARPPQDRTEWGSKTLSALRWLLNATASTWPAEILASCMSAMECVLLHDERGPKGSKVAARATEIALRAGVKPDDQQAWLENLYRRRNESVHAGEFFVDSLETRRLLDLTTFLCRWAAAHLSDDHSPDERVCESWAQAHSDH